MTSIYTIGDIIDDIAKEKNQPPLIVDGEVMDASYEPCQHHERNVAVNGVGKAMDKYMRRIVEVNNVSLDSQLRVHFNLSDLCRAAHKEFSLTALYQKGKGELFKEFMESEHPGAFLFPIPNVNGTRQDIVVDAAHSLYTNRPFYVHFLTEVLSYKTGDNKLELSLCISFTSEEMVAVMRGMSIL